MGAHASERQPRRWSASLARRSSCPSAAWMQVTPAVTGSPSTGIQSLVAHTAPWRPRSRSPSFTETARRRPVAVDEIDVAAGSSGEGAQRARRLSRNGVRVLDHQRHETETGLHDRAQVLGLAAQRREVARLRGALALVLREQRKDVFGEVPAVAAGAAVGGEAADVGPPPHRVRADAERVRDVADAQPHAARAPLSPSPWSPSVRPARSSRTSAVSASELDQNSHVSRAFGGRFGRMTPSWRATLRAPGPGPALAPGAPAA